MSIGIYIAVVAFAILTATFWSVGVAICLIVIALALYLSESRGWS